MDVLPFDSRALVFVNYVFVKMPHKQINNEIQKQDGMQNKTSQEWKKDKHAANATQGETATNAQHKTTQAVEDAKTAKQDPPAKQPKQSWKTNKKGRK